MREVVRPMPAISTKGLIFIVINQVGEYWYRYAYQSEEGYPLGPYGSIKECIENASEYGF